MVTYQYALIEGALVHIDALPEKGPKEYICPGCGESLCPVMDSVQENHFRHLSEDDCRVESYLHFVGKRLFKKQYEACLEQGRAFELEYFKPIECVYCGHGPCRVKPQPTEFNLASRFKQIFFEKPDGDFIPDLLLVTDSGDKLYVEIAVCCALV